MVASKITICQLLHSLDVGGAEMLAARLARRLRDRYRFVFACLDGVGPLGEELQREGFSVQLIGRKRGLDWFCPLRLARVLRNHNVDVLHAHQYTPFFYGLTARLRGPRRPIVFTEHGRHQPDYPRRKRIFANRLLVSGRDRLLGVGAAVRQALIDNEGLPAGRVEVLYNGIDVNAFAPIANRALAHAGNGAAKKELVVVQVARLDYLKDHLTAIRTIERVVRHYPSTRLVLIGDGPEREVIEATMRQLRVADKVQILGTRNDVASQLTNADLFLLTSISEGIPLTVLEAMAAGLPVVATDVGGLREIVVENETGFLAPARDDELLAQHIVRLAADSDLRRRLGDAGRKRAQQFFDEQRMCDEYGRIYEDLCSV